MIEKAVILCGGLATRFLPISKSIPKEMMPVLNKPVLQILMEDLKKAGIKEVLIINGRNKETIVRHFDRNFELETILQERGKLDLLEEELYPATMLDIYYKQQMQAKGTGDAVKKAQKWLNNEPFLMMFGDELLFNKDKNIVEQLVESYNQHKTSIIAVQQVPKSEVYRYGIIDINKKVGNDYIINDIIEKPKVEDAPSDISYLGPAILTNEIFNEIDALPIEEGKEIVLTNAFRSLAKCGKIIAREIQGERHDLGNKFGFLKANIYAGLNDSDIKEQTIALLKDIIKKYE